MSSPYDYDAVIVGSGFGGSVMAYRLAEAGQSVCLLERGKTYRPGSFPREPDEMRRNFWDPSEGLHGLFDIWSFRGLEALVSSGLGGGSLIYANVLLRMPEEFFDRPDRENGYKPWPLTRRQLDPHYDRVEKMLGAQQYPFTATTPKTQALKRAVPRGGGASWELPNLAVSFAARGQAPAVGAPLEGTNLHGADRVTCRLCGECDIGCNHGSKNTLDLNYLSQAKALGADIRDRSEVREIRPGAAGGYEIRYVRHREELEGHPTYTAGLPTEKVTARRLILAAGTLGTTYLLLKCRERWFPRINERLLGSGFCGNGDLLGYARARISDEPDASGPLSPSLGPVITSTIRGNHRGHSYLIQDGGFPLGAEWILQVASLPARPGRVLRFAGRYLAGLLGFTSDSNISAELGGIVRSSVLPLLGMGRERPNGRMYLQGDRLQSSWSYFRTRAFYRAVDTEMAAVVKKMGADYERNPLSYLRRVITVHPLGGCPMGRNPEEGVLDSTGRVFHYDGLYVVDGAAMPGPAGVNPSLTIAAFSDRCADAILEARG